MLQPDTGTTVVNRPNNDPGSPILESLEFVAQGNAKFIPNRAAIVKMEQNQRLVDLKSSTFGDERSYSFKDVCAHCFCTSLVCTLFIGHARATSFSSARTDSKTQQNIERMTFALTWCANIFVGCSVTSTFFSADHFLF